METSTWRKKSNGRLMKPKKKTTLTSSACAHSLRLIVFCWDKGEEKTTTTMLSCMEFVREQKMDDGL